MNETPVVVIFFNRPEVLQVLVNRLAEVQPRKLYLVCDGPRADRPEEPAKVKACQDLFDPLPWTCEIHKNYSVTNLGCRNRVVSGLNWVFEHEEQAIILEDDCVPNASFFQFCTQLLSKYKYESRVNSIAGTNVFGQNDNSSSSYFFSRYNNCWGWATWRRSWNEFEEVNNEPAKYINTSEFKSLFQKKIHYLYWKKIYQLFLKGKINSWAYLWKLSCWVNNGLVIYPSSNLVRNIGDDESATRTAGYKYTNLETNEISFPLKDPLYLTPNIRFDLDLEKYIYSKSFFVRLCWILKKLQK
ncbi:MAG: glycosyltransferase family 2 protein [Verrucomicrobia bacterium]|nr:glycosyltransferase family 2 protein [Verrucomicrobiota bacterium]